MSKAKKTVSKKAAKVKRPIGRPPVYSQKIADEICTLLLRPMSLRKICEREGMPGISTVQRWLQRNDDFWAQYARAREMQAEVFVDQMIDIADDGSNDWAEDDEGNPVIDHDHIKRSTLRVDTRKWLAGKFYPKRYSEKNRQEITGADGAALQVTMFELPHNGRD